MSAQRWSQKFFHSDHQIFVCLSTVLMSDDRVLSQDQVPTTITSRSAAYTPTRASSSSVNQTTDRVTVAVLLATNEYICQRLRRLMRERNWSSRRKTCLIYPELPYRRVLGLQYANHNSYRTPRDFVKTQCSQRCIWTRSKRAIMVGCRLDKQTQKTVSIPGHKQWASSSSMQTLVLKDNMSPLNKLHRTLTYR